MISFFAVDMKIYMLYHRHCMKVHTRVEIVFLFHFIVLMLWMNKLCLINYIDNEEFALQVDKIEYIWSNQ